MYVAPVALGRPGAPATTPMPTCRNWGARMFARCGVLAIQARTIARGVEGTPTPNAMFSPSVQVSVQQIAAAQHAVDQPTATRGHVGKVAELHH